MLRNLLILPDGTELFSGTEADNAIQSVTLTQCINADKELTLGSVCASELAAKLITPGGGLALTAGDQVTLYKVDDTGARHKQGVFTLEKPTRTTSNTMQLTGYDNMTKLDKDLTQWLAGLTGWPYNILTFASMVCGACGLTFVPGEVPNKSYSIEKFSATGVTGRQLMKWIGEVTCSFCRANADGNIELSWYAPLTTHAIGYREGQFDEIFYDRYEGELTFASADIQASQEASGEVTLDSDRFKVTDDGKGNVTLQLEGCLETIPYFQKGLDYEEYTVQSVDAVQIQLSGEDGYRWPDVAEGANTYVIVGNPLLSSISDGMLVVLENIKGRLAAVTYTPCKVSVPSSLDIRAGDILSITDKNGKQLTVYAMTAKTVGQKLTIECTGSHRRDSAEALNNPSGQQMALGVAQNAAKLVVDGQTQQDIFNKLTNNGALQGLYMQDGQLYINASYLMSGIIDASLIKTGVIQSADGAISIDLSNKSITVATKRDGASGKIVLSSSGIDCYGVDATSGNLLKTLSLWPGYKREDGHFDYSVIVTPNLSASLSIQTQGNLMLNGNNVYLQDKKVSWKDNGDGTFTLIGK